MCVFAVPGYPSKFMGLSDSSTSIIFTWSAPVKPNGVITGYTLQCRSAVGETHLLHLMSSQTTTVLNGLLPYTNYSCSIRAHTNIGEGPAATIIVNTEQDSKPRKHSLSMISPYYRFYMLLSVPVPSKVRGVTVQSLDGSATMLIVTWQPPADTNGVITKYKLDVATLTATVNNIDISLDTLRQTINDLSMSWLLKIDGR